MAGWPSQAHRHLDEVVVVELGETLLHNVPCLERFRVRPQAHRTADEVVKTHLSARTTSSECARVDKSKSGEWVQVSRSGVEARGTKVNGKWGRGQKVHEGVANAHQSLKRMEKQV